MSNLSPARQHFRALVRRPDSRLPLAEATLCIAWEDQGAGSPAAALRELDAIATALQPQIANLDDPYQIVATLNNYIFGELKFRGNTTQYHDPANSYLDQVLERRTGLPIVLSVIYMEVGWRLGLPINGVALPGHFITRYATSEVEIFVDPFNRGRLWSYEDCARQVADIYEEAPPELMQQILAAPSRRAILTRILRNLKHTYIAGEDFARALAAVERIVMLDHSDPQEIRDRGLLRFRVGQVHAALEDLERYARFAPNSSDIFNVRELAYTLALQVMEHN